ncbi:hypothetical protein KZX29_04385 [Moraxella osloensis]|uniref:hypothetical protein n=1 Tax=Faucicola osloensis TaxID=34062 RepID=UPI002005ECD0|nr:hypothetical protein [Moraxella osloensis]MCK6158035.1 hypothetical protein [Moraxella osloensis]
MEWQNEQIRFFSNSGVYRVGFGNRDKGGVLMNKFYLQDEKSAMRMIMEMCGYRTVFSKRQIATRFTRQSKVKRQPKQRWINDKYTRQNLNGNRDRDDVTFKTKKAQLKMNRFYKAVSA